MIYVRQCIKCGHEWASKRENSTLCPKCKSRYWNLPARMKDFMRDTVPCPVCREREFESFLNLARHMVLSDRPDGPHQRWLQGFLHKRFEEYAFGKDKALAVRLRGYWGVHGSWPQI